MTCDEAIKAGNNWAKAAHSLKRGKKAFPLAGLIRLRTTLIEILSNLNLEKDESFNYWKAHRSQTAQTVLGFSEEKAKKLNKAEIPIQAIPLLKDVLKQVIKTELKSFVNPAVDATNKFDEFYNEVEEAIQELNMKYGITMRQFVRDINEKNGLMKQAIEGNDFQNIKAETGSLKEELVKATRKIKKGEYELPQTITHNEQKLRRFLVFQHLVVPQLENLLEKYPKLKNSRQGITWAADVLQLKHFLPQYTKPQFVSMAVVVVILTLFRAGPGFSVMAQPPDSLKGRPRTEVQEKTAADSMHVLYGRGVRLNREEHYKQAIEAFQEALKVTYPDSILISLIHTDLGYVYSKTGEDKKALEAYKSAIKINPKNSRAHNNLASKYLELNELEKAEEHARQAILYDRKNVAHYVTLAEILSKREKHKECGNMIIYIIENWKRIHPTLMKEIEKIIQQQPDEIKQEIRKTIQQQDKDKESKKT